MKTSILGLLMILFTLANGQTTIKWMSIEEAELASKKEPRKILIDVYTDWCGWCKKMDKDTFQKEGIAQFVNENYYAVKLNVEQKDSIVFRGKTYTFVKSNRKGYHQLVATFLQGKLAYPSIVYLDENLNLIRPWPGYKGPKDFRQILIYIVEDYYLQMSFDDYQKSINSKS